MRGGPSPIPCLSRLYGSASTMGLERLWTCALQTAKGRASPLPMPKPGV